MPRIGSAVVKNGIQMVIDTTPEGTGRPMSASEMQRILCDTGIPAAEVKKVTTQIRKNGPLHTAYKNAFATGRFTQKNGRPKKKDQLPKSKRKSRCSNIILREPIDQERVSKRHSGKVAALPVTLSQPEGCPSSSITACNAFLHSSTSMHTMRTRNTHQSLSSTVTNHEQSECCDVSVLLQLKHYKPP